MDHLKILGFVFASVLFLSSSSACQMDQIQTEMEKAAMECVAHDFSFMLQVTKQMEDGGDPMAKLGFMCKNQHQIVDLVMCMMEKLKDCVPPEAQPFLQMMLKKDNLQAGLAFACEHQEMFTNECMMVNLEPFRQCYMTRIGQLAGEVTAVTDPKQVICKVVRSEEKCFVENKGACSDSYINLLVEFLDKVFATSDCPSVKDSKNDATNTLLKSILVHGQPIDMNALKYKPYQVIKN